LVRASRRVVVCRRSRCRGRRLTAPREIYVRFHFNIILLRDVSRDVLKYNIYTRPEIRESKNNTVSSYALL